MNTTMKKLLVGILALFAMFILPAFSKIKSGDELEITAIFGVAVEELARLDGDYPVSKDGTINLPFIGNVPAAGKTPDELEKEIAKAYRDAKIYSQPKFEVKIAEDVQIREPRVRVFGAVKNTGIVVLTVTEGMTIGEVIDAAGGTTDDSSKRWMELYRGGNTQRLDYSKTDVDKIILKDGDTIFIPKADYSLCC